MDKEYFRKGIVLGIIILFVGASVIPTISGTIGNLNGGKFRDLVTTNNKTTFRVNDDYNWSTPDYMVYNFSNITDAVTEALEDDVIRVCNGTYHENVVIDKKLTLEGIDEDEWGNFTNGSIIHGDESVPVVFIRSSDTVITGFTIENSSVSGIYVRDSKDVTISLNVIQSAYNGIECDNSNDLVITGNHISNNFHGIALFHSKRCHIEKNYIENNTHGIWLKNSFSNKIYWNNIKNTTIADIFLQAGGLTENEIYENNFIDKKSTYHRFINSKNDWHDNYWDDWRGLKGIKNMPPFYIIQGWIVSEKTWWLGMPWFRLDPRPRSTPIDIP
jgi:parallel beta-helix repeat protein